MNVLDPFSTSWVRGGPRSRADRAGLMQLQDKRAEDKIPCELWTRDTSNKRKNDRTIRWQAGTGGTLTKLLVLLHVPCLTLWNAPASPHFCFLSLNEEHAFHLSERMIYWSNGSSMCCIPSCVCLPRARAPRQHWKLKITYSLATVQTGDSFWNASRARTCQQTECKL